MVEHPAVKQKQLKKGWMRMGFRSLGLGLEILQISTPLRTVGLCLSKKVAVHNLSSLFHLKLAIKEVWIKKITPEYCEKLCLSMPGHIQTVLKNKGQHTKY